jgi:hypothetical protein
MSILRYKLSSVTGGLTHWSAFSAPLGLVMFTMGRCLGAIIGMAFALAGSSALADKRVALVVGNSNYKNVTPLDNPVHDARLTADTLRSVGFTLVGGGAQLDLDKADFDVAVQKFGNQLQGADVGLFYYAGHGVQVRGTNYLVPVGANPTKESDVDFQMLDSNLVLRQMEGAGTKLNIVILDACRNNPFGGRGLRGTDSGLAQMRAPEGTLISFATQPGNVAQDGAGGNSPYTEALSRTLRRPGLDIFQTFNEVGLTVMQATGSSQQPWVSSSPIRGNFYFAGPATGPEPTRGQQASLPNPEPMPQGHINSGITPAPLPGPPPVPTRPAPGPGISTADPWNVPPKTTPQSSPATPQKTPNPLPPISPSNLVGGLKPLPPALPPQRLAKAELTPEPATQAASIKEIFEKHNLLGTYAWDCTKPASSDNNWYFVNRVIDADHVQRDFMSGPATRAWVTILDKAAELNANEISVSGTRDGQSADGVWRVEKNRMLQWQATQHGKRTVAEGKWVATGKDMAWLNRCGGA